MTITPGQLGHTDDHNSLLAALRTELARFGLTPDSKLADPYAIGAPGHIEQHNLTTVELQRIATVAGKTYSTPLPPTITLGHVGHIHDHEALADAVAEASTWPAFNTFTGGTRVEVDNYNGTGQRWAVHTITANETVTTGVTVKPFRVLLAAAGGHGGTQVDGNTRCGAGGAGGVIAQETVTLPANTTLPVVIGAPGTGGHPNPPQSGGQSTFHDLVAVGGGHGGSTHFGQTGGAGGSGGGGVGGGMNHGIGGGGAGTPGQGHDGSGGADWGAGYGGGGGGAGGAAPGGSYSGGPGLEWNITGSPRYYGRGGNGPGDSDYACGGAGGVGWSGAGQPGVLIVAYQVG